MLRKIVDYKKLSHEVAALLIESYPHGYGDSDIIQFKNMHGELIEAVEVKTRDVLYLVKISKSLSNFIANFEYNIEKELKSAPKNLANDDSEIEIQEHAFENEYEPEGDLD
jgi:hypothetical protein